MCRERLRFSRDLVLETSVKPGGQGIGKGREGCQTMIQVGHLSTKEGEGQWVGREPQPRCSSKKVSARLMGNPGARVAQ